MTHELLVLKMKNITKYSIRIKFRSKCKVERKCFSYKRCQYNARETVSSFSLNYAMRDKYWICTNKIYPFVWEIYTRSCRVTMIDEKRLRKNIAPSYLRTIHRACESLVRNVALVII